MLLAPGSIAVPFQDMCPGRAGSSSSPRGRRAGTKAGARLAVPWLHWFDSTALNRTPGRTLVTGERMIASEVSNEKLE